MTETEAPHISQVWRFNWELHNDSTHFTSINVYNWWSDVQGPSEGQVLEQGVVARLSVIEKGHMELRGAL